jgi:hypothetical protein
MEKWKWIKGYKNRYMISNYGNVVAVERKIEYTRKGNKVDRHNQRKVLKPNVSKGYLRVALVKEDRGPWRQTRIHQLVLTHFGKTPLKVRMNPNKYFVNHKDGNKTNNHIDNLEWMTPLENIRHAWENGMYKRKYNHEQIVLDYKNGMSYNELAKKYNTAYATVYQIVNKKKK